MFNELSVFREMMIADTSKNHTKRINSLRGQTVG